MAQMPTEKLKIVRREEGKEEQELGPLKVLCIGNQNFDAEGVEDLKAPTTDATTVREKLEQLFEVSEAHALLNATVEEMRTSISTLFSPSAGPDEFRIFYYSGRGFADGSLAGKDSADGRSAFSLGDLRQIIQAFPGYSMIILDCCFGVFKNQNDYLDFHTMKGDSLNMETDTARALREYDMMLVSGMASLARANIHAPSHGHPAYESIVRNEGEICRSMIRVLRSLAESEDGVDLAAFAAYLQKKVAEHGIQSEIPDQNLVTYGMPVGSMREFIFKKK